MLYRPARLTRFDSHFYYFQAKNVHNETTRDQLARFMCHNTSTADRFYSLVLDRSQAKELRGHFEEVTASSSSTTKDQDSGDSAAEEDAEEMEVERTEAEAEEDQEKQRRKSKRMI